jgi:hypothetical protein
MIDCSYCVDLLRAALEASKIYHHLLEDLEAAHIRHDTELAYRLQAQEAKAVLNRDKAITELFDHEHTHGKDPRSK